MSSQAPGPTTLVVGASGATGRLLVEQLLERGRAVRAVLRDSAVLPEHLEGRSGLEVVRASIAEVDGAALASLVEGCDSAASCLGHTLSFRGIFGRPRRLVTDATRRLCEALRRREADPPARFVLMNTSGNRDSGERVGFAERGVLGLLRVAVPPHADNEQAAGYLRGVVGAGDPSLEWVAVRPDGLFDADSAGGYDLHPSPIRSAIFNAGRTSRIQVADVMARLLTEDDLWREWRGRMPVIYDRASASSA